jgi:multiple sugar transport system substrate-binding protein
MSMRTRMGAAVALAALVASLDAAKAQDTIFLSTQLRPVEEASKMRELILKGAPGRTTYVTEEPPQLSVRMKAEGDAGKRTVSLVGALHGEIQPLVPMGAIEPLDDLAAKLAGRGIPPAIMTLGKLGTDKQQYIPWMQATYVMVAHKSALAHLPAGADVNGLTYDQLKAWAKTVQEKTGKRALGFPAGPRGLMARFFQGYFYPSYTGGVVSTFKSADAEAGWAALKDIWQHVSPNSTNYNFMQEPLLAGEVLIAFDHVARVKDALTTKPDDFVAFPAPAGPKGRGFMPVIAGLSITKGAPNKAGAEAIIEHLTKPETQLIAAAEVGFFPVVKAELPPNLPAGVKLLAAAVAGTTNAKDALPSLLPIGLGDKGGEFNKVYMDTFQRIILKNEDIKTVLGEQAKTLAALMDQTKAPCWSPDKASTGPCPVN